MNVTPKPTPSSRRKMKVCVISDVHLGTFGCKARELVSYLRSVQPETLVINGDFVDIWQLSRTYFPKSHLQVIKEVFTIAASGAEVYYVTGNHDEMLRRMTDLHLGNFHLVNKMSMELDGKKAWIFHGDVFDATMRNAKWLARMGANGYGFLILINKLVNQVSVAFGGKRMSFSRAIKKRVKSAFKKKKDYEQVASELAIENGYDYLLLGHIHHPQMKRMKHKSRPGEVLYLNSGDWVENNTALEYADGQWSLFRYESSALRRYSNRRERQREVNTRLMDELMHQKEREQRGESGGDRPAP